MVNLQKGQSVNLNKESGDLNKVTLGLGWVGKNGKKIDLDSFVALRDKNGNNLDLIYFGNLTTKGITHNGDDLVGGGSSVSVNETIDINLSKLPANVHEVICGLFMFSSGKTLKQVDSAFVKVYEKRNDLLNFNIKESFGKSKSVIVGKLIRNGSEWNFETIGEASSDSYNKILQKYSKNSKNSKNTFTKILEFILELFD